MKVCLLLSCRDRSGLVAQVSGAIHRSGGNITALDQHVDDEEGTFFMRVVWQSQEWPQELRPELDSLEADWRLVDLEKPLKTVVMVSKPDHCLRDLLWRWQKGEINCELPLIVSNHPDLKTVADSHDIPYQVVPVDEGNQAGAEAKLMQLLEEVGAECIVLARYMRILSPEFVARWPGRIINIHHSFLPAFAGGHPYRQAHRRGVKIIGATSHYVTAELDEGPIIDQDVTHISHRDSVSDLSRKGRDLERLVLARALRSHLEHRVLLHGRRTVVFGD